MALKRAERFSKDQVSELKSIIKNGNSTGHEVRRANALLLWQNGIPRETIEAVTDYNAKYIYKIRKRYIAKGINGILEKKKKPRSLLTRGQREQIVKTLQNDTPRTFGFQSDHWTTGILGWLIKEQYNVHYKSKSPIYIMFKEAKLTFHKPGFCYLPRNQEQIDAWKKETVPFLKEVLNNPNCEVFVSDEMILTSQTTFQKIWLPIGNYPKIEISVTRKKRGIAGFLNVRSGRQHAYKYEAINSKNMIKSLERIGKDHPGKKIIIFWDNASWHNSKEMKEYLRKTSYNFVLKNFPPYAPDENPQEHVWKVGRKHVSHNRTILNVDKVADEFIDYLNATIFRYNFLNLGVFLV